MGNIVSIPLALFIHNFTPPYAFVILILLITLMLLAFKKRKDAFVFAVAFFCTIGIVVIMKYLFAVPRPPDALIELSTYAFPSSHAALSMFTAIMCGWFTKKYTSLSSTSLIFVYIALSFLPLIIGLSRLSIGVHTPFQVFTGFCIGALIPFFVIRFVRIPIQAF